MKAHEFFTFSSEFEVPAEQLMVKQAYIYILKQHIERLRDRDCFACLQNIPLVNSMHDDGCCMEWDETVEKYLQICMYITNLYVHYKKNEWKYKSPPGCHTCIKTFCN